MKTKAEAQMVTRPDAWGRREFLLATLALGLMSCGKSPADSKGSGQSPVSPTATGPVAARRNDDDPDLLASALLLPGLVDSSSEGSFIELVKAIDEFYDRGRILITAYPVARAYSNVAEGVADFGFPVMRLDAGVESKLPYRFSAESVGQVCFVLYSNTERPITANGFRSALNNQRPYEVEAPPLDWGFPTRPLVDFESSFRKISAGRIDGLLWAQEEADQVLRQLGLKNIHREHFRDYDDVFIVPRSERGNFVDRALGEAIRKLRASGRLSALYANVHHPYQEWQP